MTSNEMPNVRVQLVLFALVVWAAVVPAWAKDPLPLVPGSWTLVVVPDTQRYFDVHHSESDTFSSINERELELEA